MPNEVKLLPCAWCNGPALNVADEYITCGAAWNTGCPGHMIRTDAEHWNTRPTTVVTDEVVERVARAIALAIRVSPYVEQSALAHELTHSDHCDLARAAIAAMPTVVTGEQQGWQPIESAPKDGSAIILAVRGRHPRRPNAHGMFVTAGRWLWSRDARLPHDEYPDDGGFLELNNDWGDGWGGNIGDRFWQPLPEPPAQPGDA